jgi:hypothetical protein
MPRSIVQICNEAISDLPAHPITAIDDTSSKEARECSRHLSGCVSDLIDDHDYDFVERDVTLAATTHDRSSSWAHAYAVPDGMVSPILLVRDTSTSSVDVVVTPILYWPNVELGHHAIAYEVANGILYTNLENAILRYSTDALEPAKWPPLFAQAVIRLLAARIYRPILGEKADTREWLMKQQAAQRARNEAVASDLNRNPRRHRSFVSEAASARQAHGYGDVLWRR